MSALILFTVIIYFNWKLINWIMCVFTPLKGLQIHCKNGIAWYEVRIQWFNISITKMTKFSLHTSPVNISDTLLPWCRHLQIVYETQNLWLCSLRDLDVHNMPSEWGCPSRTSLKGLGAARRSLTRRRQRHCWCGPRKLQIKTRLLYGVSK